MFQGILGCRESFSSLFSFLEFNGSGCLRSMIVKLLFGNNRCIGIDSVKCCRPKTILKVKDLRPGCIDLWQIRLRDDCRINGASLTGQSLFCVNWVSYRIV